MPSKRGGLASAVINGSIYVFGGEQHDGTCNNNEKYDTTSNNWTSEKSMPTARHDGLAVISFDNKIYVIACGQQPGGSVSSINEVSHVVKER